MSTARFSTAGPRAVLAALLLVVPSQLLSPANAQGPVGPNLLVIVPDDLGVDSVGCYGTGNAPPTPNIDLLAQAGMRFTKVFVNPACSPTRAAILTGRHAYRGECTGALANGEPGLTASSLMLSAPFAVAGYATAMIGKWHVGYRFGAVTPGAYGWGHFEGILDGGVANPFQWTKVTNGLSSTSTQYILTDQINSAINWIQSQTGPWCLVVSLTLPHNPYHAPPANLHSQNLAGLDPATTPRPFFVAMVEAMDKEVGRLLATIAPSVLNNTNVVFVGDNGTDGAVALPPSSSTRGKGSLYDGGAHVPLIVRGPAVTNPGTTATELLSGVDLFPTLLGISGIAFPAAVLVPFASPLDGQTFQAALAGQSGYGRSHIYSEISSTPLGDGYTIRTNTHRLIRYMQNQPQHQEFYDLVADPTEQNDLLAAPLSPTQLAAFQQLSAQLETIRSDGWGELFGDGCAGGAGIPFLRWQSQPRIGTTFVARLSNLAPSCTAIAGILGMSRTTAFGTPLPIDLSIIGLTGCNLNVSLDLMLPMYLPAGFGIYLAIPPSPALYQSEFFMQGMAWEAAANPAGLILSRGLRLVIGQ